MTRRFFQIFILSLLFAVSVSDVFACSCGEFSVRQKLRMADAIFAGEIIETTPYFEEVNKQILANKVIFKVEKQWKGKKNPEIPIFVTFDSPGWCGDMNLAKGERYLIYAFREKDKLITHADCGPNLSMKWEGTKKELAKLNDFWYRLFSRFYPYPKF